MDRPLNFRTEGERHDWIMQNADYFTVVQFRNRKYERHEFKYLADAREAAHRLAKLSTEKPWMIYAVHHTSDTLVEVVT